MDLTSIERDSMWLSWILLHILWCFEKLYMGIHAYVVESFDYYPCLFMVENVFALYMSIIVYHFPNNISILMLLLSKFVTINLNYNMKIKVLLTSSVWALIIMLPVITRLSSSQWLATFIILWSLYALLETLIIQGWQDKARLLIH